MHRSRAGDLKGEKPRPYESCAWFRGEECEQRIAVMDKVEFPDLNRDQARRMALLVQLLEHCDQPEAALELAERMERFVLHGSPRGLAQRMMGEHKAMAAGAAAGAESVVEGMPAVSRPHGRGTKKRRWTAEEDEKLRSLAGQDLSLEKIAAELNRTIISVRERARARQIKVKPRKRGRRPSRQDDGASAQARGGHVLNGKPGSLANGFGHRGKRPKGLRNGSVVDDKACAELVEKYLLEQGVTRPETSIETVIKFMRTRDYSIVRAEDGRYVVDERDHLTPAELVERANSLRLHLGQPIFPKDLAH